MRMCEGIKSIFVSTDFQVLFSNCKCNVKLACEKVLCLGTESWSTGYDKLALIAT